MLWAWTNHAKYVNRYAEWSAGGLWKDLPVYRLRSVTEIDAFIEAVANHNT